MNEKYLLKLQQDMRLKNFTPSTCEDYYRFVKRFLDFTCKDAMSITYADIRKFIFHMKDYENKKASTINVYTAAIRFFFEYTLGYMWDSKKIPKMNRPMGWLFPSTVRDEPLTTATVEMFIKNQAQMPGLPEGVTPHTMRHYVECF